MDDNVLQGSIYIVALSLFSSLESLAQEINVCCGRKRKERNVDYNLFESISPKFAELAQTCSHILENKNFCYLKGLRNLVAHRRVLILASDITYIQPKPIPFRPYVVEGSCINYLPDDPLVESGQETYKKEK